MPSLPHRDMLHYSYACTVEKIEMIVWFWRDFQEQFKKGT